MRARRHLSWLPNLLTLGSIFCGFSVLVVCMEGADRYAQRAGLLVLCAMILDVLDGRVARLLRVESELGVQLDSLADLVSFGVAPAVLAYRGSLSSFGLFGLVSCFAFVGAGALRLARFNVLALRTPKGEAGSPPRYALGLPIPSAAGMLVSFVLADASGLFGPHGQPLLALGLLWGLSLLMVSTVKLRTFKDERPSLAVLLALVVLAAPAAPLAFHYGLSAALLWFWLGYLVLASLETVRRVLWRMVLAPGRRQADGELPSQ